MRQMISMIILMCLYSTAISKELTVVTEVWPPYSYTDKDGRALGIATETVKNALATSQLNYSIKYQPWARAFHVAKSKPNILIYPIFRTLEREALFHWFCPILPEIHIYAISKRQRALHELSLKELMDQGVTAGVMRAGNNYERLVAMGFDKQRIDTSSTELANIRKLIHDRVDVVFQSKEGFEYGLKQLSVPVDQFSYGAALRKEGEVEVCAAIKLGSDEKLVGTLQQAFAKTPLSPLATMTVRE